MTSRLQVGPRVALDEGVPDGLIALRLDTVIVADDGTTRVQSNRRGRVAIKRVILRSDKPSHTLPDHHSHRQAREALAPSSRRRTNTADHATHDFGIALARAGLVELHADVTAGRDGLHAEPWNRWERTDEGTRWANLYRSVPTSPAGRHARTDADKLTGGSADDWHQHANTTADTVDKMLLTARSLLSDDTAAGWSLSRFANQVCGDTHALDTGSPLATVVLSDLAQWLGVEADVATTEGRAELFAAAGLGVDMLASWVACSRVPPGNGPAAGLLQVGLEHNIPVNVPRIALTCSQPVAPPPASTGWIFAVENEGLLTEAHRLNTNTPVVWYGSTAAAMLLRAAARAGWRVAVSADFEPGALYPADWLLHHLGDAAVPWRLSITDYQHATGIGAGTANLPASFKLPPRFAHLLQPMRRTRRRVTEEDRADTLLSDIAKGHPSP